MINKCDLLSNFLNDFKPDIMMLNETKCTAEIANFNFDHPKYELMIKQRTKNPNHGGGVAIIIKKTLNFSESKEFNHLNEEFICVKLKINNSICLIGTLYTPPNKELNKDLFNQIKLKYKQFLIGGDLNSKLIKLGCNSDNNSGHILDEIIETNNLFIKNNKQPTYFEYRANTVYSEILDLIILSNDLNMNNSEFKVHTDSILTNDINFHCPVEINIHTNVEKIKKQMVNGYNYKAADWELFKNTLYVSNKIENNSSLSCEQINDIISNEMLIAKEKAIPKMKPVRFSRPLPSEILKIINEKNSMKKKLRKLKNKKQNNNNNHQKKQMKTKINSLVKIIKTKISEFRSEEWKDFIKKIGPNPVSSRPYWQRINRLRTGKSKASNIPDLKFNDKKYENDNDKANLFKDILKDTFQLSNDESFKDKDFYSNVDSFINDDTYLNNYQSVNNVLDITMGELKEAIKACKSNTASGIDNIHNQMIKNLPDNFLSQILTLFNKSIQESKVCQIWKTSKITMINKKDSEKSDPANYRPISVTSCLGKVLERIINNRLYKFCEENGYLSFQQSGFRKNRGVKDNLTFLTQKVAETFNRKKKMCCLFFDISKAFDKVWHNGLIYKLVMLKCPLYIVNWIKNFLKDRKFQININGTLSDLADILCSVPQGSILSPLLFSIYINDIPKRNISNSSGSLLYADDLATFFMYKKNGNIEKG